MTEGARGVDNVESMTGQPMSKTIPQERSQMSYGMLKALPAAPSTHIVDEAFDVVPRQPI
jgi:hypothetical protein